MIVKTLQVESTNSDELTNKIVNELKLIVKEMMISKQIVNEDVLLTRQETASMLGISLVSLWTWTKGDIIPAYKIGNKVRYKKSEILKSLVKKNKF